MGQISFQKIILSVYLDVVVFLQLSLLSCSYTLEKRF